jgi:hypothetical protein
MLRTAHWLNDHNPSTIQARKHPMDCRRVNLNGLVIVECLWRVEIHGADWKSASREPPPVAFESWLEI